MEFQKGCTFLTNAPRDSEALRSSGDLCKRVSLRHLTGMDPWVLGSEAAPCKSSLLKESVVWDLSELRGGVSERRPLVGEVILFPQN